MNSVSKGRLNNKGFTLIELLAVVVILAVVMGIAISSVLTAMNKSRGGSLQDSAMVIATAFNQKYTEALVDGVPSKVYGGSANEPFGASAGYNFQSSATYYIDAKLASTFNITTGGYSLDSNGTPTSVSSSATSGIGKSFVKFNVSDGKFIVCMFANKSGSYFVDNYKTTGGIKQIGSLGVYAADGEMYACSDGSKSW